MWYKLAFVCYAVAAGLAIAGVCEVPLPPQTEFFIAGNIACGGLFTLQLIQNLTLLLMRYARGER